MGRFLEHFIRSVMHIGFQTAHWVQSSTFLTNSFNFTRYFVAQAPHKLGDPLWGPSPSEPMVSEHSTNKCIKVSTRAKNVPIFLNNSDRMVQLHMRSESVNFLVSLTKLQAET